MVQWRFFLPVRLPTLNRNLRHGHPMARYRKENKAKVAISALAWQACPKRALVCTPHPQRILTFTNVAKRFMDDDGWAGACKGLIDVLKCYHVKHRGKLLRVLDGVVYDDSRTYARLLFDQRKPEAGEQEGVEILIEAP